MREITIGLVAPPNSGKTTLFNRLVGTHQTVGNWPGVTVEKRVGELELGEFRVRLVDLPGAYSLTPSSQEEQILRDYLLESPPDLVLNIAEATNLYQGLGLTLQLAMAGLPMVVAVNMMDEAHRRGLDLDLPALAEHLGRPVVPLTGRTGEGVAQLQETLLHALRHHVPQRPPRISFPPVLEQAIRELAREVEGVNPDLPYDEPFVAARLMEGQEGAATLSREFPELEPLQEEAQERRQKVERALETDLPTVCAQCRFNAARGLVGEATHGGRVAADTWTERLDALLLNRVLGLPLFFLVMLGLFQAVYSLAAPLQDGLGAAMAWVKETARGALGALGAPGFVEGLLVDGVLEGAGVVITFFPLIGLFFLFLSLLEGTGYLARAAYLMDRLMHFLRLDGKAFINLVLGFGCNVPAIMGMRILSGRANRIRAMLLVPFSLCTARLQVFVFLAGLLFAPAVAPWVVFAMYLGSFAAIVLVGLILRPFSLGGEPEPFIMELPPYRVPLLRTVALRAGYEMRDFLYRAATLIVAGVVVVWLLTHFPPGAEAGGSHTLAGYLGRILEPVFLPLGLHWQEVVALVFGLVAKEVVIGAMAVIYGTGGEPAAAITAALTPLQGLSFMVFTLLYAPCLATFAVLHGESRSWGWTGLALGMGLVLAWLASFAVYQGGKALGF
jgi:ferrous iron transport protein B